MGPLLISMMALFFLCQVQPQEADGGVINAASCSQQDVQVAIDSAGEEDTINVPAGSCTWTGPIKITRAIRLRGAGYSSADGTRITAASPNLIEFNVSKCASSPEIEGFLFINTYKTSTTLSGVLKFRGNCDKYKVHDNKLIHADGGRNPFITVGGGAYGVIYANIVEAYDDTGGDYREFLTGGHGGWNEDPLGFGDFSWSDGGNYYGDASEKFWYVEGNTFVANRWSMFSDVSWGARTVYRYNSITNGTLASHGFDSNNSGRGRSVRLLIGYNNQIHLTDGSNYGVCWRWRTGTGILYDNDFGSGWNYGNGCIVAVTFRYFPSMTSAIGLSRNSGVCAPYSNRILLCAGSDKPCSSLGSTASPCSPEKPCTQYVGQCSDTYSGCNKIGQQDVCNAGAMCTNYTGSHYLCNKDSVKHCCYPPDTNGVCSDGTRCKPIGSKDVCSDGSTCIFPNPSCIPAASCVGGAPECLGPVDNSNGSGEGPPCRDGIGAGQDSGLGTAQAIEPIFAFKNSGASARVFFSSDGLANLHYYTDATGGVTTGWDASKPTPCTPGYGYFANDTRTLYRCNKGGTGWDIYYKEFPCPHPLTGLSGTCNPGVVGVKGYFRSSSSGPSAPSGLRVIE